jgi:hypothetical protein
MIAWTEHTKTSCFSRFRTIVCTNTTKWPIWRKQEGLKRHNRSNRYVYQWKTAGEDQPADILKGKRWWWLDGVKYIITRCMDQDVWQIQLGKTGGTRKCFPENLGKRRRRTVISVKLQSSTIMKYVQAYFY